MSPGTVDPCPPHPQTLNFLPNGVTAHLHMTPVQFFDPVLKSWMIFAWGENSQLHKWSSQPEWKADVHRARAMNSPASMCGRNPPGGMPGGFCSGSSHGADPDSAILVCTVPYGDANAQVVNGRFLVYDPVHLAADGSLKVLWDSQAFERSNSCSINLTRRLSTVVRSTCPTTMAVSIFTGWCNRIANSDPRAGSIGGGGHAAAVPSERKRRMNRRHSGRTVVTTAEPEANLPPASRLL